MFTSSFSANALLAKAKAMYGKALKTTDYANMLNCHSVSEIAAYLKNNTAYNDVLNDINVATINRGHLEMLLRRKVFNDYASLTRFDKSIDLKMTDYLIQRTIIELIISSLRSISVGRGGEFFFTFPMDVLSHTGLDFAQLIRCKNYDDFLSAVRNTDFYKILTRFRPKENEKIRLTEIETALYTKLVNTAYDIISNAHGSARDQLKSLFDTRFDAQNVTRILRLKRFFSESPDSIRKNLLPYSHSINKKIIEKMIEAPDADSVVKIFASTKIGRMIPESQRTFTHDLHHRAPFAAAQRLMHYSVHPSVVLLSYIFLTDIELDDIINIIEGIRYRLRPDEIKPMLVLANY